MSDNAVCHTPPPKLRHIVNSRRSPGLDLEYHVKAHMVFDQLARLIVVAENKVTEGRAGRFETARLRNLRRTHLAEHCAMARRSLVDMSKGDDAIVVEMTGYCAFERLEDAVKEFLDLCRIDRMPRDALIGFLERWP